MYNTLIVACSKVLQHGTHVFIILAIQYTHNTIPAANVLIASR